MRPELTATAIERALAYGNLGKLIVIIDGLRECANEVEIELRKLTIEISEAWAHQDNRIDIWIYSKNLNNNTEHVFRTHRRGLDLSENSIWVEEDMEPDFEEFASLVEIYWNRKVPFLLAGASGFNHLESSVVVRNSLFSNFWLQSLNFKTVDLIEMVFRAKYYNPESVERRLNSVFESKDPIKKAYLFYLKKFWIPKLYSGLTSNFRWDALAQYAFMSEGIAPLVANQNLVSDLGYANPNAMNFRKKPEPTQNHKFKSKLIDGGLNFCIECEKRNSRIGRNLPEVVLNSLKYRLKR